MAPGPIVFDDPAVVDRGVREVWGSGAFPDRPDIWRGRLEAVVDTHVAASVDLDVGLLETDPGRVGCTPDSDEDVAALDPLLAGCGAHQDRDVLSRSAVHTERLGSEETFDAFRAQDPLHFPGNLGIFPVEKLRIALDDRDAAAEATVGLAEVETDIAPAEHDEVWRDMIELQRCDAGQRVGCVQAGTVGHHRARADVEEALVGLENTCPPAVQTDLECLWSDETAG